MAAAQPSGGGGVLAVAWNGYLNQLSRRPLRTKALTSACIAGLSDVVAQNIATGRYSSWKRTLAVACFGFLYSGPSAHFWQKFMEYAFQGKRDLQTVLLKVLVDQSTYGPVCNVLFMAFASLVLEGRTMSFTARRIRTDFPAVQRNGWRLWPLAALINYKFVPVQFRVLFINVVALLWTTFLILRSKHMGPQPSKAA